MSRNSTPPHGSHCVEVLFCNRIQGNANSEAAPAVLAAQGRTTVYIVFKHADFKDASVSKKRLNTTGKLHIAITKAGHCNKPEVWIINSLLYGFIQMLWRYTLLPFILLNPNLSLRFPFAVHFKRHFGAILPVSSMFGRMPCTLCMFYENNTWGQLYSHAEHHAEAGASVCEGPCPNASACKRDKHRQDPKTRSYTYSLVAPSWSISPSGTKL